MPPHESLWGSKGQGGGNAVLLDDGEREASPGPAELWTPQSSGLCCADSQAAAGGSTQLTGWLQGAADESAEREAGPVSTQGFSSRLLLPRGYIPVLGMASPVWRSLGVPGYRYRGGPGVDKHLEICLLAAGWSLCATGTCDFVPLHNLARRQGAATPGVP